jgi:hypothetical protein
MGEKNEGSNLSLPPLTKMNNKHKSAKSSNQSNKSANKHSSLHPLANSGNPSNVSSEDYFAKIFTEGSVGSVSDVSISTSGSHDEEGRGGVNGGGLNGGKEGNKLKKSNELNNHSDQNITEGSFVNSAKSGNTSNATNVTHPSTHKINDDTMKNEEKSQRAAHVRELLTQPSTRLVDGTNHLHDNSNKHVERGEEERENSKGQKNINIERDSERSSNNNQKKLVNTSVMMSISVSGSHSASVYPSSPITLTTVNTQSNHNRSKGGEGSLTPEHRVGSSVKMISKDGEGELM